MTDQDTKAKGDTGCLGFTPDMMRDMMFGKGCPCCPGAERMIEKMAECCPVRDRKEDATEKQDKDASK